MSESSIQQVSPNNTALNAEHYQTFEMAKANDDVLGGKSITAIRGYAARVRAEAQVIHKSLSMMSDYDDAVAAKSEIFESEQTLAKVGIYADQRIGEILRELPTKQGARNDITSVGTPTKVEAEKQAGISHATAIDLQKMAANPEVVEAVIAKAEQDGRVVSRSQVLKEIDERKRIERELKKASIAQTNLEMEAESLRQQLAEKPEPEVIEREVEVVREVVPEETQRHMESLEYYKNLYEKNNTTLRRQLETTRKELDRAKGILNMGESTRKVQSDVEYLIAATNQYVRNYGGLTWTFEQIDDVDEITREELRKAVKNLATFSSALVASLEQM